MYMYRTNFVPVISPRRQQIFQKRTNTHKQQQQTQEQIPQLVIVNKQKEPEIDTLPVITQKHRTATMSSSVFISGKHNNTRMFTGVKKSKVGQMTASLAEKQSLIDYNITEDQEQIEARQLETKIRQLAVEQKQKQFQIRDGNIVYD
ncbi:Hypothetical_protein [Hexamita inflata]|uniref:Hypothetical_protein n=1 Tax=Hexamita inflata TaxID=28002 RepID=A0AA86RQH3_9EUKA|nr:Hypothetical protein HINF_LOCUS63804 [Hexamita inflata]